MTTLGVAPVEHSTCLISSASDASAWDAYVSRHPEASAYHFYEWRNVITRAFGHETRYLLAESSSGVVGVLPLVVFRSRLFGKFVVSMPFLNYGGVLADTPEAEAGLLDAGIAETRAAGGTYLELRHARQHYPHLQAKRHKVGMVVAVQATEDGQWQAIDRKVRNQVRKAQKCGLRTVSGGAELLEPFYGVFARNMRDLGTPVYGVGWFREILQTFADRSRVFVVFAGTEPVAGALVHWRGPTLEVPWASSLREFNPQCPNVLLYWEMLRFAVERRFERFDLGRSTPGEGTFHFKRQWGAEPRELVWEYWTADGGTLPNLSPTNPRFSRAIDTWRRLPVGLTRVIGPRLVSHIP